MKLSKLLTPARFVALTLAALATATLVHAKAGATDPIPGTSKGTVNSGGASGGGGGGGKNSTPVPVAPTPVTPTPVVLPPAPPPAPFVSQTLTFTPVNPVNGVTPLCTGSYHIDPYYPTLSLMTVNVETSSVNVPDGTLLTVAVTGTGGTLYPFTSNVISVIGGYGLSTYSVYITLIVTAVMTVPGDRLGHLRAESSPKASFYPPGPRPADLPFSGSSASTPLRSPVTLHPCVS